MTPPTGPFDPGGLGEASDDFCDSFDHLPPAQAGLKYGRVVGAYTLVPGPRYGDGACFTGGGNFLDYAPNRRAAGVGEPPYLGPPDFKSALGSAWLSLPEPSTWGGAGAVVVLALVAHTHADPGAYTTRAWLEVGADGAVTVRRSTTGGSAVVCASAAGAVPFRPATPPTDPAGRAAQWAHVEWRAYLDPGAAGLAEVRVDGALVASATGAATVTTTAAAAEFRLGNIVASDGEGGAAVGAANAAALWADDFWFTYWSGAAAGTAPPASQGPLSVCPNRPAGPGFANTLLLANPSGTAPADHWTLVAEAAPDGDATWLESRDYYSLATGYDVYALGPWPDVAAVPNAQRLVLCWWLARAQEGTPPEFARTAVMGSKRFFDPEADAGAGAYVFAYSDSPVDATYRLSWSHQDASDATLASLQLGLNLPGPAAWWRCTHLFAELVHATLPVPDPPAPGGGPRWSVGWVG